MRRIVGVVAVLALGRVVQADTIDYVDAIGNEWRDLNDTGGFSWD